jgi:hypothetical protein
MEINSNLKKIHINIDMLDSSELFLILAQLLNNILKKTKG